MFCDDNHDASCLQHIGRDSDGLDGLCGNESVHRPFQGPVDNHVCTGSIVCAAICSNVIIADLL